MADLEDQPAEDASVLSSLPGTRPQRRSPKRPATKPSRRADPATPDPVAVDAPATAAAQSKPRAAGATRPSKSRPAAAPRPTKRRPARVTDAGPTPETPKQPPSHPRAEPPPPAQGFEANPIVGSVDPPTGTELLASVAQGATELAELGLALARRLARTLLDRLPRI
jgi:hypothetical protein